MRIFLIVAGFLLIAGALFLPVTVIYGAAATWAVAGAILIHAGMTPRAQKRKRRREDDDDFD